MANEDPLCVCGNPRSAHTAETIHPFTERDGPRGMNLPDSSKRKTEVPTNPTQSLARLLGVLKDRGIIDDSDIVNIIGIPSFQEPKMGVKQ